MSKQLTNAAVTQFDAEVKHAYQGSALLRDSVTVRTGVVGESYKFAKMGQGTAQQRTPQTDVTPMNVSHSRQTANLEDWVAPEYTDIFDQAEVNYQERQELAGTIAMAIGRREDQLILDALEAASTSKTVSTNLGGTGTGLNTTKVRRTKRLLDEDAVQSMDRTMVISAEGQEQLLGDDDANTVDKNAVKMLVEGEVTRWVGFKFIVMDERAEGGLPKSSTLRTNFAYHKQAIGCAIGVDFRSEVNYVPQKTSWLAAGIFKAGAVARDAEGIGEVDTTETT